MDVNAEVSTQLSLINALLSDLDKTIAPCNSKKNAKKEEENQDAMPDSTTNTEKSTPNTFHCGDDVLVPNKDGRYYLGTIVELSTSNDNDSCEVGVGLARCLVKFGDGTHSWATASSLKLLSAPPADDGCIMCVVCKRREGTAASPADNAVIACDMCGRGYHAKCHTPPVDAWINGASWHCRRCVDQRYRVAAAENRALKRSEFIRFKGNQHRMQQQELTPLCDTASTTSSTASELGKDQTESHCYCGEKSDWLAQMLLCCRCSRWFHQRCVSSLRYPLYAGDKLYIFACANCNGGKEYLRRLELCWLELAHLALYNLTAYNAPNYFDLDTVIMPYIMDNWHALQLPEKMWRTPANERRERILTALTSSRKRFKCGREMKKRATIWGLRLRRPPPAPHQLSALAQIKKGESLSDELVREYASRLRFLPKARSPHFSPITDDSSQPTSSNNNVSSYKTNSQRMIVPVDGKWLNLMMGKRFHENLNSNSNSENDSTSSYESAKPNETDAMLITNAVSTSTSLKNAKDDSHNNLSDKKKNSTEVDGDCKSILTDNLIPCSVQIDIMAKEEAYESIEHKVNETRESTYSSKIATMNLEVSKLSTKNIIEHSKIMSLQHMNTVDQYYVSSNTHNEHESSGDETSSRGTLDAIIPPLKDFQGKNNPFLMQSKHTTHKKNGLKTPYTVAANLFNKQHNKPKTDLQTNYRSRMSLPIQYNTGPMMRPLKRQLSEKDIIIGPNGEVKRRKYRRPRKNVQLNQSCPLPLDTSKNTRLQNQNMEIGIQNNISSSNLKLHGRRLRQRQEKNYYENAKRSTSAPSNNSVKSLKLSPHKDGSVDNADPQQLSALKSSVQSYFRAGQTFRVLARRLVSGAKPAYLIEWDTNAS